MIEIVMGKLSKTINTSELITAYKNGKSMSEIANDYHCSLHKVVYWMKKHGITRRSRSDAAYIKANPQGDPFNIKKTITNEEKILYGLGIGLYWGEGTKATKETVRVTNTDVAIIKVFKRFLEQICGVIPTKIHYSLVTFNDINSKDAAEYWSKQLEISEDKFGTIVSIPSQGKGTYKKKSQYGVCSITVSNIKLKRWIMDQIENSKHAWIVQW